MPVHMHLSTGCAAAPVGLAPRLQLTANLPEPENRALCTASSWTAPGEHCAPSTVLCTGTLLIVHWVVRRLWAPCRAAPAEPELLYGASVWSPSGQREGTETEHTREKPLGLQHDP